MPLEPPKKIVVFLPNWVGDAVMATPALRAIRQRYPSARIAGLMKRSIADTLKGSPWLDEELILDRRSGTSRQQWWDAIGQMRQARFDWAVLLTNSFVTALAAWLGGTRRRIGYDRDGRRWLLTDRLDADWTLGEGFYPSPVIDYYLKIAEHLGATNTSRGMELFLTREDRDRVQEVWRKLGLTDTRRVVALNPGSAFGPAKRWPVEYFAELARQLIDRQDVNVVVMCGPAERDLARKIAQETRRAHRIVHLADERISIGLSKAVVARSDLLVSTDSGPRHFAPAFHVPIVALFGPTHIEWTETYYPGEIKLQRQVDCGPCQKRECPKGHHRCMTELAVADVYRSAADLLREYRRMDRAA